ncbi:unnamed protein product, partial [Polarella glacialis]
AAVRESGEVAFPVAATTIRPPEMRAMCSGLARRRQSLAGRQARLVQPKERVEIAADGRGGHVAARPMSGRPGSRCTSQPMPARTGVREVVSPSGLRADVECGRQKPVAAHRQIVQQKVQQVLVAVALSAAESTLIGG